MLFPGFYGFPGVMIKGGFSMGVLGGYSKAYYIWGIVYYVVPRFLWYRSSRRVCRSVGHVLQNPGGVLYSMVICLMVSCVISIHSSPRLWGYREVSPP